MTHLGSPARFKVGMSGAQVHEGVGEESGTCVLSVSTSTVAKV